MEKSTENIGKKTFEKAVMDEKVLLRLMDEYGDMLLKTCCLYLKDYYLAEDAVQETFIKAAKSYNTLQNKGAEKAWLVKIAVNCCKSMLRGRWLKHYRYSLAGDDSKADVSAAASMPDLSEKATLSGALTFLKPTDRSVLILYYYWGFNIKEIAEMIGKSEGAVSQRLSRARKKLKKVLLEAGYDE